MANLSWINFLAPGFGSLADWAFNGDIGGSGPDNFKNGMESFFKGFFNPLSAGSDGSSNPITSFLNNTSSNVGESIGNGLYGFADKLINNLLGPILQDANKDPDYTVAQGIGDLFTGGAVSANKETRLNNAWQREFSEEQRDYERAFASEEQAYNRAFAEDERAYQRGVVDPFNMNIQSANLGLQQQSLAHQISMDEFNKDLALHGTSLAAKDAASVGINPLAMSGQVSPFSSSVGSSGASSGISSQGASSPSSRPGSASSPSLGQLATFAPIQQFLSTYLGIQHQRNALKVQSDYNSGMLSVQNANVANSEYANATDRLKALIDAKKAGFKVSDDMFSKISEDITNSYLKSLHTSTKNVEESTTQMKDAGYVNSATFALDKEYKDALMDLISEQTKSAGFDRKMKVWSNANDSVGRIFDLVGDIFSGIKRTNPGRFRGYYRPGYGWYD